MVVVLLMVTPSALDVVGGGIGGVGKGLELDAALDPVAAARHLADVVLTPAAQRTDQSPIVPADNLRALAQHGLYGLIGPKAAGGLDAGPDQARAVFEALAGACGATFFVWAQHHSPVRMLRASENAQLRRRWLPALCAGTSLAGVAFAYLRRPGPAAVVARAEAGGYRLDGVAPWVTSWGLADVYLVAALLADDIVWVLVEASAPGLSAHPLRLAVMQATGTVRLTFGGVVVPAEAVVTVQPLDAWRARDRLASAQPNPAAFGVAETCLRLLGKADMAEAATARAALTGELDACRERWAALDADGEADVPALVAVRAWSQDLAVRAAHALVASRGGRAMSLDNPAQRLLREAGFYAIQAQTLAGRRATLRRFGGAA